MIFRLVVGSRYYHVGSSGYFEQFGLKHACHGVAFSEVVTVYFIVNGGLSAHTHAAGAYLHFLKFREVLQVLAHKGGYLRDAAVAIAGVGKTYVHRNNMRAVVAEVGKCVVA